MAPSYDKLLRENQELKLRLSHAKPFNPSIFQPADKWDGWESLVFSNVEPAAAGVHISWPDLNLPSRALSSLLLSHDKMWNSWVHYGLQYPQFEHEHDEFWDRREAGGRINNCDPFWLAVYFAVLSTSLLSSSNEELAEMCLSEGTVLARCRNLHPLI